MTDMMHSTTAIVVMVVFLFVVVAGLFMAVRVFGQKVHDGAGHGADPRPERVRDDS